MDPWQLTLTESAAEQASGRLSSVELVGSVLDRIEAVDAKVGAFRVVLGEEALAQARACDAERSAGRVRGPMHGLPVAVKDVIDVAGQATTGSSRAYADRVAQHDAHCVTRLRAAGAVIVGKTETHELALGVITPTTRNSRDLSRIPGGSSGGSGAAVAAGTGALALGTDTGGSVRIPASLCGVVGLKPSYGRVSNSGLMPTAWSLDTIGPIARDVPDAALALMVLAGHDSRDPVSLDLPAADYRAGLDRGVDGLVLGLATGFFAARVQPAVTEAVTAAAEALARCGATVRPVELPAGEYTLAFSLARPEAAAVHARVLRERPHLLQPSTREALEQGSLVLAVSYVDALRARARIAAMWRTAFDGLDAVLLPATPATAVPAADPVVRWEDGVVETASSCYGRFNRAANLTGQPALSIPCGHDRDGLPIGLQIIGRPFDEATVLRIGRAYEIARGWPVRPGVGLAVLRPGPESSVPGIE